MIHFTKFVLFIVCVMMSLTAKAESPSNPYIVCGTYQPTTKTLTTKSGEKLFIENTIKLNTPPHTPPDAASPELCFFAKSSPSEQDRSIQTLPYAASPKEVKSQGWSALRCGDLVQENGTLYLKTESEKLALSSSTPLNVEANGIYCAYSNTLPVRGNSSETSWNVEKISLDGKRTSGVSVGN
jgi:hypothetical protein